MMTDDSLINYKVDEAREKIANGGGNQTDWIVLILNRQCVEMKKMTQKLERLLEINEKQDKDRANVLGFLRNNWKVIALIALPTLGINAPVLIERLS